MIMGERVRLASRSPKVEAMRIHESQLLYISTTLQWTKKMDHLKMYFLLKKDNFPLPG